MDLGTATRLLGVLGDPSRVRLVALLARQELSVAELVEATGLVQSRVSTHLGRLREAGVVRDRRAGTSTFYSLAQDGPEPTAKVLALVRGELRDRALEDDARRAARIVDRRAGAAWPEAVAGRMEQHYSPGRTWESMVHGLLGLVRPGDLLDVGSGDGTIASMLAPRARSVTLLDRSEKVIAAARKRLRGAGRARFVVGDAGALPFPDGSFDTVLLFHVLSCVDDPALALREAARVLRPDGAVAILVLDRHDHPARTAQYGHVRAGISPGELEAMLLAAGLEVDACAPSSRERREPYFQVVSAFARRPARAPRATHSKKKRGRP